MVDRFYSADDEATPGTIVLVRFATPRQARACHMTLIALFDRIETRVDELFEAGGGEATLAEVAAVYEEFGFSNDNGWEQEHEISLSGNEVVWPLSYGARRSEVENLLMAMEPASIEFHDPFEEVEPWRLFPLPETLPLPDDTEGGDYRAFDSEFPGQPPKRVIH